MRPVKFIIYDKHWNLDKWELNDNDGKGFNLWKMHFIRVPYTDKDMIVLQFTGLEDMNGKEIYEGFILEDSLGRRKVVEYYQDGFWLNASLEGAEWSLRHTHKSSKIIGNIYENPELLSGGKK